MKKRSIARTVRAVRVAALQFDIARGDIAANLRTAQDALARAAKEGLALVVLPEMWPSSFPEARADRESIAALVRESESAVLELARTAAGLGLLWCGSSFAASPDDAAPPTNRLHLFDGDRRLIVYDKVHLFTPTAEDQVFSAGRAPPATVETRIGRMSGVVCYDVRFPELTRRPFLDGAEVLLVPAQWPDSRASHWRALLAGLAVANQCFVIGANRTGRELAGRRELELSFPGNSLIAGPDGRLLAEGHGEQGLVAAEIEIELARDLRRRVPVERDRRPDLYALW
jgi:predicted amidohydrolase